MKDKSLRVLIVEDSEDDVLLIIRKLKKGGYNPVYERVETAEAMKKAMEDKQWDTILCDYKMPNFSANSALNIVRDRGIDIPFIMVSGAIGEDTAVEAMKSGMHDYLMKDNLSRLVVAIEREIREAKVRQENRKSDELLKRSEENFRHSLDDSPLGIRIITADGETLYANQEMLNIFGYDNIEELRNISHKDKYTPESYKEYLLRKERRLLDGYFPANYEVSIVRKDGNIRHLEVFRKKVLWNGEIQFQALYNDITERKQAEVKSQQTLESLRKAVRTTIQVMVSATEMRDPYTAGHQSRVADLARTIATEMKLSQEKIEGIRMAGSIHDIGKISIPSEILVKPTKLTNIEFSLIKEHPHSGYEMLKDVETPWPLAQIVYQHHERMNGSGYPRNLKGDDIIIEARIMAVADVVEAMASHRPYRPALGIDVALEEIEKNKGVFYDATVADACLKVFREKGYQLT